MSVAVPLVRALVDEVARVGAPVAPLLAGAGITPEVLDDPDARVDVAAYDRLTELALAATGDAALGLHMAERAALPSFHVLGLLIAPCRTLREALAELRRYRKVISAVPPPTVEERGDEAIVTCHYLRGSAACNRVRAELSVVGLVRAARTSLGIHEPLTRVELEHAAPPYADEVARVLGCEIVYGAPATRLVFPRRLLDAPLSHANEALLHLLRSQADLALARLVSPPRLAEKVRAALVGLCTGEKPTMVLVARRVGVSARSLRRRLRDESVSFSRLVDEAMAEAACRLLSDPSRSIQEVAAQLGFSEPSAFHRAFKRWTGQTPAQCRDRLRAGQCGGDAAGCPERAPKSSMIVGRNFKT